MFYVQGKRDIVRQQLKFYIISINVNLILTNVSLYSLILKPLTQDRRI